jgi:hypothetical protein
MCNLLFVNDAVLYKSGWLAGLLQRGALAQFCPEIMVYQKQFLKLFYFKPRRGGTSPTANVFSMIFSMCNGASYYRALTILLVYCSCTCQQSTGWCLEDPVPV